MNKKNYPQLEQALEDLCSYLPKQGPLDKFVHHNTLHSFEHLSFHEAVQLVGSFRKAKAYMSRTQFMEAFLSKRIDHSDLDRVMLRHQSKNLIDLNQILCSSWQNFVKNFLFITDQVDSNATIQWKYKSNFISKREFHLWKKTNQWAYKNKIQQKNKGFSFCFETISRSNDEICDFSKMYFDQAVSYWPLIKNSRGYLASFVEYSSLAKLSPLFSTNPIETIRNTLRYLSIKNDQVLSFLIWSIEDVRGWSSLAMSLNQSENKNELRPELDFVAARLLSLVTKGGNFEVKSKEQIGFLEEIISDCFNFIYPFFLKNEKILTEKLLQLSFGSLLEFTRNQRLALLQEAYEEHYFNRVLATIKDKKSNVKRKNPNYSAVFCIDDREESTRRHLEEVSSSFETYGYAGFFNIDMQYQSWKSQNSVSLCPVNIVPRYKILELPPQKKIVRHTVAYLVSKIQEHTYKNSKKLISGSILHLGLMVQTILFDTVRFVAPRRYYKINKWLRRTFLLKENGKIDENIILNSNQSFTINDLAERIQKLLIITGLQHSLTDIIFIIGHGSTSLNNPHESAYNCGACSGQHGGPNARVFATAANNRQVRQRLFQLGVPVPESTIFIGGYHDTCSDEMDFYDLDTIPKNFVKKVKDGIKLILEACKRSAKERARRFESISFKTKDNILDRVSARSMKYAQPRPECGHATNALCIVGDRSLSSGIFLDRRAFLCSYDNKTDQTGSNLAALLASVVPVCAGINLEYYFSFVDNEKYGCGTKMPHNICGMVGVINGPGGDLRTGLPWQMVEIHEPLRLLLIVQAPLLLIHKVKQLIPEIFEIIERGWLHLKIFDSGVIYDLDSNAINSTSIDSEITYTSSENVFQNRRDHIDPCLIITNEA